MGQEPPRGPTSWRQASPSTRGDASIAPVQVSTNFLRPYSSLYFLGNVFHFRCDTCGDSSSRRLVSGSEASRGIAPSWHRLHLPNEVSSLSEDADHSSTLFVGGFFCPGGLEPGDSGGGSECLQIQPESRQPARRQGRDCGCSFQPKQAGRSRPSRDPRPRPGGTVLRPRGSASTCVSLGLHVLSSALPVFFTFRGSRSLWETAVIYK